MAADVCACEPGFTCSRCRDTPHDPAYFEAADRDDERARDERDADVARLWETWLGSVFR